MIEHFFVGPILQVITAVSADVDWGRYLTSVMLTVISLVFVGASHHIIIAVRVNGALSGEVWSGARVYAAVGLTCVNNTVDRSCPQPRNLIITTLTDYTLMIYIIKFYCHEIFSTQKIHISGTLSLSQSEEPEFSLLTGSLLPSRQSHEGSVELQKVSL